MSVDLATFLGSKVATSVDVGGLYVPVNSLARYLQVFSEPALFHNPDYPDLEISRRGTLLKCEYGARYFALVTAHQTADFDFEQLAIHERVRSNMSTSNSCTFSKSTDMGEEKFDFRLYEFTEAVEAGNLASIGWLKLRDEWFEGPMPRADLALAVGFPTVMNETDFDRKHLTTQPYAAFGKPCTPAITGRQAIRFDPALDFDPDGFSGAPVYGLFVDLNGVRFSLLGVATNAGSSIAHYLPLESIKSFIEKAVSQ